MTYPSLKETHYHAGAPQLLVLTVPHGADASEFLRFFPEIAAHPEIAGCWELFQDYLAIEQDAGAGELAHSIASHLQAQHGVPSLLVEWTYPRGIVDGGRLRGHARRSCLPASLADQLAPAFEALHEQSLFAMDRVYERVRHHPRSYLLDVHTMASHCPVDADGNRKTIPVSFESLGSYIDQYKNAPTLGIERRIDLITDDESGAMIADRKLTEALEASLLENGYTVARNDPYHAAPIYLSHQHMKEVPSLSLDVPKHLLVRTPDQFRIERLPLDPDRIARLARVLADGLADALLS